MYGHIAGAAVERERRGRAHALQQSHCLEREVAHVRCSRDVISVPGTR